MPFAGGDNTATEAGNRLPSGSWSLASTVTPTGVSSGVNAASSTATGGSLTSSTVTVTVAVPQAPSGSQYW